MWPPAWLTGAGLALLLLGEWRGRGWMRAAGKTMAAAGFVCGGWYLQQRNPGLLTQAVLVGLVLSLVGDLCLLAETRRAFLGGLGAFLLAHVAYVAAFVSTGPDGLVVTTAACVLAVPAWWIHRWISPHLPAGLAWPVLGYLMTILLMVSVAAGSFAHSIWLPVGAVAFMVSDVAVARQRFVRPAFLNKLWGLPLYFGAQWMFIIGAAAH